MRVFIIMTQNIKRKILLSILSVLVVAGLITFFAIVIHLGKIENGSVDSTRRKVIIDTDAGGDDAIAILLALASKKIDIIAITCSYGNAEEKYVETNVLKILTIANRSDIPVYGGAVRAILKEYAPDGYFGKDGLGDFHFDEEINGAIDESKHASVAMIELSKKYSGELDIITLGPLTNIALASLLDVEFTQRIRRFYMMGGQVVYETGEEKKAEFNFGMDPESDAVIFNSLIKNKVLIIPWDVVLKNEISKDWRRNVFGKHDSTVVKFLNKVEQQGLKKLTAWYPADAVAMAVMLWSDLVTSSMEAYVSIVTCGTLSGVMNVDLVPPKGKEKSVEIVRDFNVEDFKRKLLKYLV